MADIRSTVKPFIMDLLQRNREVASKLRGGAFCASFGRKPDGEPWVQVKTGVLNIFYPRDTPPLETIRSTVPSLPPDAQCEDWEPWKYATFEFSTADAATMTGMVEELFVNFYEFPSDIELICEIFDMRDNV